MKKAFLLPFILLLGHSLTAQLINNGATITIMEGATLKVETNVINNVGSTIEVLGTLDITGDLINEGDLDTDAESSLLRFSGEGNSVVASGGAVIRHLEIDKAGSNYVELAEELHIGEELEFSNGQVRLEDSDLFLASATVITGADADGYIVTNGMGMVEKTLSADAMVSIPLGDEDNYSPLSMDISGSGYTDANVRTAVVPVQHPEVPADASDYIARYWQIQQSGIDDYNNDWTGTFVMGDVEGTVADIVGASFDPATDEWSYLNGAGTATTVSGTVTAASADVTGTNFYGQVMLKAFLAGAYNAGTGLMTTTLNTNNLIPLESPYATAPAEVDAIPAGVTDWIRIDVRDASTPATVLSSTSAFILNNGDIVGLDGVRIPAIKNAPATGHVSVHHRNHLAVRTPAPLDLINPSLHDFSTAQAQAYQDPTITSNDAMRFISGSNPSFCLWAGDVRGNGQVLYNGGNNDRVPVLQIVGGLANANIPLENQYTGQDTNMDGSVIYNGGGSDRVLILANVGGIANANFARFQHL
jgi:hypothetical protein